MFLTNDENKIEYLALSNKTFDQLIILMNKSVFAKLKKCNR